MGRPHELQTSESSTSLLLLALVILVTKMEATNLVGVLLCCIFAVASGRDLRCLPGTSCIAATNGSIVVVGPEFSGLFQIDFPKLDDSDMILLEFLNSSVLAPPSLTYDNSTGDCLREHMSFMGSSTVIEPFKLCGDLTGQHVYLSYGLFPVIYMSIVKEYNSNVVFRLTYFSRKYRPVSSGCLQYYTGTNVQIQSFGWPATQLNNLRYTICFDETRANSLRVTDCASSMGVGTFSITGIRNEVVTNDPEYQGPYSDLLDCYYDWIQLFGQNKYCNHTLPYDGLATTTKPFQIAVNFDREESRAWVRSRPAAGCESLNINFCFTCQDPVNNLYPDLCNCVENPPQDGASPGQILECRREATLHRVDRYNRGFCLRATLS